MVYYDAPHSFTEEESALAQTIAAHIAFAIEHKRSAEEKARLLAQVREQGQRLENIVATVPGVVWEAWGKPDEANQRIDFVSQHVEAMLGYSREEWLSTPNFWLTIVHPDDRERAARVATEHFTSGKGGFNRFRWLTKDGRVLWVEAQDMVIKDADGTPLGMRGVTMDISERMVGEEERGRLLVSEQSARAKAEEAERGLATVAEALDRALAEAELLNAITKAASGEDDLNRILASTLDRLKQVIPFTGGSIALVEGEELVLCAAVGPFTEMALGMRLPRGNSRTWQVIERGEPFLSGDLAAEGLTPTSPVRSFLAVPLVWRSQAFGLLEVDSIEPHAFNESDMALLGKVAAALSGPVELARRYTAEVRAVQRAEAAQLRLALLAEVSNILAGSLDYETTLQSVARLVVPHMADLCIVDLALDGQVRKVAVAHADPSKEELLHTLQRNYAPAIESNHPAAVVMREGKPAVVADVPDSHLEEIAIDDEHLRLMHELGYRSYMVVPLQWHEHTLGTISFISGGSGRRYTEEDLSLAEEVAHRAGQAVENARLFSDEQEAVRAREELLSIVSHDMKNPLGNIKVLAQLMKRRIARGEAIEPERLTGDLSRIEGQVTKMNLLINELLDFARLQMGQALDLDRRSADLVALARQVAAEADQAHDPPRVRVEPSAPALVGVWDPDRIERAISNLVSNALKYSPRDSEVTVEVGREEDSGPWAVVAVRDQGVGIPADDLPHIFEWFRRAGNVTGRIRGTGVGLAGARQIVEQHGGTITVESEEGLGSTFTVRLPLGPEG
jgi:PAS domain S-box-containing protein